MVIVCLVPKPLLNFTVYKNYPEEALCLIDIKFRNEKDSSSQLQIAL